MTAYSEAISKMFLQRLSEYRLKAASANNTKRTIFVTTAITLKSNSIVNQERIKAVKKAADSGTFLGRIFHET